MVEKESGFGMHPREDPYGRFINKAVCAHHPGNLVVYGILTKIEDGKAFYQPSLVGNPDASEIVMQSEMPTVLDLPVMGMRPLPEGMLERYIQSRDKKQNDGGNKQ